MDPGTYCREIEGHLCRQNRGHLIRIVGPAFDRVCGWAEAGVPLSVVVRGIDRKLERQRASGGSTRPLRVEHCEADILEVFEEWRRAVAVTTADIVPEGGASAQTGEVSGSTRRRSSLPVHLDRVLTQASNLLASREPAPGLHAALHRLVEVVDGLRGEGRQARGAARAAVVARLVDADAELMALTRSVAGPYLKELGGSADLELAPFRARMTEAAYVKARAVCVDRFLRERYRLPTVRFD